MEVKAALLEKFLRRKNTLLLSIVEELRLSLVARLEAVKGRKNRDTFGNRPVLTIECQLSALPMLPSLSKATFVEVSHSLLVVYW